MGNLDEKLSKYEGLFGRIEATVNDDDEFEEYERYREIKWLHFCKDMLKGCSCEEDMKNVIRGYLNGFFYKN